MYPVFRSALKFAFGECLVLSLSLGACAPDTATHTNQHHSMRGVYASTSGKQLSAGRAHSCSLDAAIDGVICWGDNRVGQTTVPLLAAPTAIAAGGDTSCAISSSIVQCWGDNTHNQLDVPFGLFAPTQLAVGDGHVCALTSRSTVQCWGDNSAGQSLAPELRDVDTIVAGARHSCALANAKVTCWGDNSQGQLDVPALELPTQLVAAGDHACVLDSGNIHCWGAGDAASTALIPIVEQPTLLATGAAHSCVLGAKGVQCWGDSVSGDLTPRELTGVTQLAVGGGNGWSHACSRDLQGVKCWGADNFNQTRYNGEPLHVLHHSEANIDAPSDEIWAVLMDLDSYPEWNPYTIAMKSTLKIGDPMVMTVKMSESDILEQTENIRVLEPGHKVCWGIDSDSPELNSGERCQWLEALPGGGTRYITEDLIEGTLNPLVTLLYGDAVQNGFDAVALALKKRVE